MKKKINRGPKTPEWLFNSQSETADDSTVRVPHKLCRDKKVIATLLPTGYCHKGRDDQEDIGAMLGKILDLPVFDTDALNAIDVSVPSFLGSYSRANARGFKGPKDLRTPGLIRPSACIEDARFRVKNRDPMRCAIQDHILLHPEYG